jgi:hypothetical protein
VFDHWRPLFGFERISLVECLLRVEFLPAARTSMFPVASESDGPRFSRERGSVFVLDTTVVVDTISHAAKNNTVGHANSARQWTPSLRGSHRGCHLHRRARTSLHILSLCILLKLRDRCLGEAEPGYRRVSRRRGPHGPTPGRTKSLRFQLKRRRLDLFRWVWV